MEKIYRVRPINDLTIGELTTPYLWFSKVCGFKDQNDANIKAFVDKDSLVANALRQKLSDEDIDELDRRIKNYGICCFTEILPSREDLQSFVIEHDQLQEKDCICIEFDKDVLEKDLINTLPTFIPRGFHKVEYYSNGAEIEKCDELHFLDECGENYRKYVSIKNLSCQDFDNFVRKLLSTKSTYYNEQKEVRYILAPMSNGQNLDQAGYEITIPREAITAVYTYGDVGTSFLKKLKETGFPVKDYTEATYYIAQKSGASL